MALKILATGDIHLGKKSSGIRQDTAEIATKQSWDRMVGYAIESGVDVLVLTGDIVDQDNRYFEAIGPLQSGFEKLKQSGISVFMIAGNHDFDVLPQLINSERYDNVHLLGARGGWERKVFSKNGEQIQFVGWSFPGRHVGEDPLSKFDLPEIDSNIATIGLLHGDVGVPDSKYAPIDFNRFLTTPVHAWILGHIHKPQLLRESAPIVCYPGSLHALSSKEQGIHGPMLLQVESRHDIQITQIPLSPVRFESLLVDITDTTDEEGVRDIVTSKLFEDARSKILELETVSWLIYDLVIIGRHSRIRDLEIWLNPIVDGYDQEMESTETRVVVRKIVIDVEPKVDNMEELAKESSPAGIVAGTILALQNGETTEFANHLTEKWKLVHASINESGTFFPLRTAQRIQTEPHPEARQYILKECRRILTELIG